MLKFIAVKFGNCELPPIMLLMATGAIDLRGGRIVRAGVITNPLVYAAPNFRVAIQALEPAIAQTEIVASSTLNGAFQVRMRMREGPGRNLPESTFRENTP